MEILAHGFGHTSKFIQGFIVHAGQFLMIPPSPNTCMYRYNGNWILECTHMYYTCRCHGCMVVYRSRVGALGLPQLNYRAMETFFTMTLVASKQTTSNPQ
jgi:hypothetical protein